MMKIRQLLSITALIGTLITSTHAATIADTNSWTTSPIIETVNAHALFAPPSSEPVGGRGFPSSEVLKQTFTTSTAFNLTEIYLSWNNYSGNPFQIKFYQVANPEVAPFVFGAQVGDTINIGTGTDEDENNLHITLGAESVSFAAGISYALVMDGADGTPGGGWRFVDNGTNYEPDGRAYEDVVGTPLPSTADFGMALVGTTIPEPSTLGMLGCAVFGLLLRRRR